MEKKQKFNVGDTVYYVRFYNEHGKIYNGTITGVDQRMTESGLDFKYYIGDSRFSESKLFSKQSEVIRVAIHELLDNLNMDEEKVAFICKTLFPEEYNEENDNELSDEDFEKLETKEEPLKIEEKTSFWKGLFN